MDQKEEENTYCKCNVCGAENTQYVAKLNTDTAYKRAYCTNCKNPGPYSVLHEKCNENGVLKLKFFDT